MSQWSQRRVAAGSRARFSRRASSVVRFGLTRSTGVAIDWETTAKHTGTASMVP